MWEALGKLAFAFLFGRISFSLAKAVYSTLIAHIFRLNLNLSKTGKWAIVTGATDGIGKQYAFELAKRGLNVVLISRTLSKLQTVAEEIEKKYPIETKVIAADFTKLDIYDKISNAITDLDIGVLVNNVGMSYEYPEYLLDVPNVEEFADTMLNMNIHSVNRMTFLVLPGMLQRKRGIIINIASLSATIPCPFLTLYAATKSYVESFSRNLDLELTGKGVTVQCVIPGFVATNLSGMKKTSFMVPSPKKYVEQTITTVGVEKRTAGYVGHKMMIYGIELMAMLLPGVVLETLVYNNVKGLRSKFLKRRERAAKQN